MDLALLIIRLVVGAYFFAHGAQKLFGWFGGHGLDGTAGFFEKLGLKPGRLNATAAGVSELGGGVLIALGLFTPFGAAAIIGTMVVAIATVHLPKGPFGADGGYELNVVYIAAAVAITGVGPGAASFDSAFGLHLAGTAWALGALAGGVVGGLATVGGTRTRTEERSGSSPAQPA